MKEIWMDSGFRRNDGHSTLIILKEKNNKGRPWPPPGNCEDGGLFVFFGLLLVVKVEGSHREKNPDESIEYIRYGHGLSSFRSRISLRLILNQEAKKRNPKNKAQPFPSNNPTTRAPAVSFSIKSAMYFSIGCSPGV